MNDKVQDSPQQQAAVRGTRDIRRARARRIALYFAVVVGLPTLLAAIYYGLLASPRYTSVAVFTVLRGESLDVKKGALDPNLETVRAQMLSRAMLDTLNRDHGFVAHYQGSDHDFLSRLPSDAGTEAIVAYYRERVTVSLDAGEAYELRVEAYSPEVAKIFATAILEQSAAFLEAEAKERRQRRVEPQEQAVAAARDALAKASAVEAVVDMEVARLRLASALRGLEEAEVEAAREARHLRVVAEPAQPSEPSEPRRIWGIATVLVTALALGGVGLLLADVVREHAKF